MSRSGPSKVLKSFSKVACAAVFLLIALNTSIAQQPSAKRPPGGAIQRLNSGAVVENTYRNPELGINYKIVLGWVDRTSQFPIEDDASSGQLLLAVFEHPPEVKGEDLNSTVLIAAENMSSYPEAKTATDYFDILTEATTSEGFKVVGQLYTVTIGSKPLVRGDFSKEMGKHTMYQSSLVMLSKGYALSFTFMGSSEDEVEQLISHLSFPAPAAKH